MSSYHSKAFYSPPDGSSGSLPITPTEEEPLTLGASSSLPPSLGKLILNRSTPYNLSPPSSFGSSSSSSSSSIASQQSTMSGSSSTSGSVLSSFGGLVPSSSSSLLPPPHVALLPPPPPKTYQYVNHQHQPPLLPPPSLPYGPSLHRIVLPPLEPAPRHLSSVQHASASSLLPTQQPIVNPQPQTQRSASSAPMETANRRHEIKFHELREQQQLQHQLQQQARATSSASSSSAQLPPPTRLPPPNTARKPPTASTSTTTTSDSPAQPSPPVQAAEYPMMSLVVRKRRRRTSPGELAILDAHFAKNALPTAHEREVIAKQVEMTPRHIQIWFQNKRQTEKKRLISGGATYPDDKQPTSSGSSSPSEPSRANDSTGQPSSSSPSTFTNDLPLSGLGLVAPPPPSHPKSDGEGTPKLAGNKENIPPLHRTNSSHLPLLAVGTREAVDLQRSRSEGVVVMNGGRGAGIDGPPSRSLSRGSGSTVIEAGGSGGGGGIMDQVVGRKELPFVSGTSSVGGASGVDIWKNMMSDPPSGGLEEFIGSDDEDETMLDSEGEDGDGDGDDAMDGRGGGGIKGIRSTQQRQKQQQHHPRHQPSSLYANQFTPTNSSLSRRLSTTSTASSGSSSNTNTQLNAAASSSKTPNNNSNSLRPTHSSSSTVSVTTTLARSHLHPPPPPPPTTTSTPRHFTKTLSHAQISSGRRNPSSSHPLLLADGARGMRRSASLDWAASRAGASGSLRGGRVSLGEAAAVEEGGRRRRGSLRKRESFGVDVDVPEEEGGEGRSSPLGVGVGGGGGREFGRTSSSMSTASSGSKRRRTGEGVGAIVVGETKLEHLTTTTKEEERQEEEDAPPQLPPKSRDDGKIVLPSNPSPSPALPPHPPLAEDEECARLLLGLFSGR